MTTKMLDYSTTTYGLGRADEPRETKTVSLIQALRAEHAKMVNDANTILRAIQVLDPNVKTTIATSAWKWDNPDNAGVLKGTLGFHSDAVKDTLAAINNAMPKRSAASRKAQSLAMKRSWKQRKAGTKATK